MNTVHDLREKDLLSTLSTAERGVQPRADIPAAQRSKTSPRSRTKLRRAACRTTILVDWKRQDKERRAFKLQDAGENSTFPFHHPSQPRKDFGPMYCCWVRDEGLDTLSTSTIGRQSRCLTNS